MARIHMAFAALALTASAGIAQAQSLYSGTNQTMPGAPAGVSAGVSVGAPAGVSVGAPAGATPALNQGVAPPYTHAVPPPVMVAPTPSASLAPAVPTGPAPIVLPRGQVPTPEQPFTGLELPKDSSGDGAYAGGGVVIEYYADGTKRVIQR